MTWAERGISVLGLTTMMTPLLHTEMGFAQSETPNFSHTQEDNLHTITVPERNTIIWATVDCHEESVLLEWQRPNLTESEFDSLEVIYNLEVDGRKVPRAMFLTMDPRRGNLMETIIPLGKIRIILDPIGINQSQPVLLPREFDLTCTA